MRRRLFGVVTGIFAALASVVFIASGTHALSPQQQPGNFSLQVTPSPLVTTVKPGEPKKLELKIRNASTTAEKLKIELKSFKQDELTGEIDLNRSFQPALATWTRFSAPTFEIGPGEWYTQTVTFSLPAQSGFSYSAVMQISRQQAASPSEGRALEGSVAVFALVNVDRPGATRSLELDSFTSSEPLYEFLPATLDIRLKNTGNTIAQPYGNVYIQRNADDTTPIATLPVNDNRAYLLPDTTRTLQATWSDGFPVYDTRTGADGQTRGVLNWNWDQLSHFRIGRYTAKVVAVYNDGTRDVPVRGEVTFWVIPWKAILILMGVIVLFIIILRLYIKRRTEKAVKKALAKRKDHETGQK